MNADFELDQTVLAWLAEAPDASPESVIDAAFAEAATVRQARALVFVPWRDPMSTTVLAPARMGRPATVLLLVLALVVAIALVAIVVGASHSIRSRPLANGSIVVVGGARDAVYITAAGGPERPIAREFLAGSNPRLKAYLPTVSPDGSAVAFLYWAGSDSGRFGLAVTDVDGRLRRSFELPRLKAFPDLVILPTAWSPDSSKIVVGDWQTMPSLWMADLASGSLRRMDLPAGIGADSPAWAPDGRRLLFRGIEDSTTWIATIDPDGRNVRRIVTGGDFYSFDFAAPVWSPDGQTIAYSGQGFGGAHDIFVTRLSPPAPVDISNATDDEYYPAWSPDGTRIAWEIGDVAGGPDVMVADADGSHAHLITSAIPHSLAVGPHLDWSPDGRSVLTPVCSLSQCDQLAVLDATGSAPPVLMSIPGGAPDISDRVWAPLH